MAEGVDRVLMVDFMAGEGFASGEEVRGSVPGNSGRRRRYSRVKVVRSLSPRVRLMEMKKGGPRRRKILSPGSEGVIIGVTGIGRNFSRSKLNLQSIPENKFCNVLARDEQRTDEAGGDMVLGLPGSEGFAGFEEGSMSGEEIRSGVSGMLGDISGLGSDLVMGSGEEEDGGCLRVCAVEDGSANMCQNGVIPGNSDEIVIQNSGECLVIEEKGVNSGCVYSVEDSHKKEVNINVQDGDIAMVPFDGVESSEKVSVTEIRGHQEGIISEGLEGQGSKGEVSGVQVRELSSFETETDIALDLCEAQPLQNMRFVKEGVVGNGSTGLVELGAGSSKWLGFREINLHDKPAGILEDGEMFPALDKELLRGKRGKGGQVHSGNQAYVLQDEIVTKEFSVGVGVPRVGASDSYKPVRGAQGDNFGGKDGSAGVNLKKSLADILREGGNDPVIF